MAVSNAITGPQPETTINQLLQYLIAINGHSTVQLPLAVPQVTLTHAMPSSTTSEQPSSCSSPVSPRYNLEEDTTTSSDESITSIASDRQLRPHVPINYNETIFKMPTWKTTNQNTYPSHF